MNVKIRFLINRVLRSSFLLGAITSALFLFSLTAFITVNSDEEFLDKHADLVVRKIGDQLLRLAGDSTSRVMPVRRIGDEIFQLEFQNQFSFIPDSLVKVVDHYLASGNLPLHYIVNVYDCRSRDVVYGFEINSAERKDVVPCLGRVQPTGCYKIQIDFLKSRQSLPMTAYYFSLIALTGIGVYGFVRMKKVTAQPVVETKLILIGKYTFDPQKRILKAGDEVIDLSNKESQILEILSASANQLIDRDALLKSVWENEGVITGRSLDMFISKLRKKLAGDGSVQIKNVHGRGYVLEIF